MLGTRSLARTLGLLCLGLAGGLAGTPALRAEMVGCFYLAEGEVPCDPSKDSECRRRLELADERLEGMELQWQTLEKLRWQQEKVKLQTELDAIALRNQTKSMTVFEQELEKAKLKAQEDNRRMVETEKKEKEDRARLAAEHERNYQNSRRVNREKNNAHSTEAKTTTVRSGSVEIGGLDRSSNSGSSPGATHGRETGRSSTSVHVDTTVIPLDQ